MTQAHDEGAGLAIESRRTALAQSTVSYHFKHHPELQKRYPLEQGMAKCLQDADFHFAFLAQALELSMPSLFASYVQWAASMLGARGIPSSDLADNLGAMREAITTQIPGQAAQIAAGYIDYAAVRINQAAPAPYYLDGDDRWSMLAREYLDLLLRGDRTGASALISAETKRATAVADIYLRIFRPALYEVGRLWQANEITVAQEHYCSAATQLIMSQLFPLIFNAARRGKTIVAACAAGELHEIGLRTVADLFEMAGWDTHYLGGNVPVADLLRMLADRHANVLAISATIAPHLNAIKRTITAVRSSPQCRDVRVIVGGYAVKLASDIWRKLGADGFAEDAAAAVPMAEQLLESAPVR
jgi:MerR family transcriptional regulator, light-induced transcriptional regulator